MNRREHILSAISEEAGEVVQAVGKCLRFGMIDENPNNGYVSNGDQLIQEVNDLIALVELLGEYHYFDTSKLGLPSAITAKKEKYHKFSVYSKRLGFLWDEDEVE